MKKLVFVTCLVLGLTQVNAQVANNETSNLTTTKKIEKSIVVKRVKKLDSKKVHASLKRTVKIVREEKEIEKI